MQTADVLILGGGPAGLTAAIYAERAGLDALCLEQGIYGGQISTSNEIDNYPGFESISGAELGEKLHVHAEHLGCTFAQDMVSSVAHEGNGTFSVVGMMDTYAAKALIVATGATPKKAGFTGEEAFTGRGVSYCATCDAMFYRDRLTYVVGGGNTACEEADFLTRFASDVIMVVRKDHLRAQQKLVEKVEKNPRITIMYNTKVAEVAGDGRLSSITLENTVTGEQSTQTHEPGTFGVFVFIGHTPKSELVQDLVEVDREGAIIAAEDMSTKTPGLFVAGDVRKTPLRQVITACGDGAIAATSAALYLGSMVI
jgi:thioredoxin reductase (NADPH)